MHEERGLSDLIGIEKTNYPSEPTSELKEHFRIIQYYLSRTDHILYEYGPIIRGAMTTLKSMGFNKQQIIDAVKVDYMKYSYNKFDATKCKSPITYVIACMANLMSAAIAKVEPDNE